MPPTGSRPQRQLTTPSGSKASARRNDGNGTPPEFAARIRKVCAEKGITLDRFDAAPEDEDGDEDADDE